MAYQLTDEELGVVLLGIVGELVKQPAFPLVVKYVNEHRGDDGQVDHITLGMGSGLRYRIHVELLKESHE